jgi:gamma-glutamylputrescine oxidase
MSTISFWHSLNAKKANLLSPQKVDVVIVGAGITGLSVAYWLKKESPQLQITIIEQFPGVGRGASGRNAGFNTAGSFAYLQSLYKKWGENKARSYWSFKQQALKGMQTELSSFFSQADFLQTGSTTLFKSSVEKQNCLEDVESSLGDFRWEDWPVEKLRHFGLSAFTDALHVPIEGQLNSQKLLDQLFQALLTMDVSFLFETQIYDVASSARGVKISLTRAFSTNDLASAQSVACELSATHVFFATNGYLQEHEILIQKLNSTARVETKVQAKRAQMASYLLPERKKNLKELKGNFYDPSGKVYFRQYTHPETQKNVFMIGGFRLLEEASENSLIDKVTPVIQSAFDEYSEHLWGEKLPIIQRWSGPMGFTTHELPIIIKLEKAHVLGGYSGHGMGIAFKTAEIAAKEFLGNSVDERIFFHPHFWK